MQIFQTSSDISTPEKLAVVIADDTIARYKDIPEEKRKLWLGTQIYGLCLILHYQAPSPQDVEIDCTFADQMIMEDAGVCCLKQVEMQEAFRLGISKEYGEFYGITASSLVSFLKSYKSSDKRANAINLLYKEEQNRLREEDERFWAALADAKKKGFDIPSFSTEPFEDNEAHRKRIEQQYKEIMQLYGK